MEPSDNDLEQRVVELERMVAILMERHDDDERQWAGYAEAVQRKPAKFLSD